MEKSPCDFARAVDSVALAQHREILEHGRMSAQWTCDKFRDPYDMLYRELRAGAPVLDIARKYRGSLCETVHVPRNVLLDEGINELFTILASAASGTKFDSTNAYIGVGDSATGADHAQTGLQAATNKIYKGMDAGYPTYGSLLKATWRSTYATSEANWAWEEYSVANGNSDAAKNLNRKCSSLGTKTNAFSWVLTLEVSLT